MNLRHTVLLTLAAAFLVIIVILFFISTTYILSSYEDLESAHVGKDVGLVRSHLESRVGGLAVLVKDWGAWEDTYLYAGGQNPAFIDANLAVPILPNLQVNAIIITDTEGTVLYATGFDLEKNMPEAIPHELEAELADPASPLRNLGEESAGLLSTSAGTMIVAAHPVLHSDNSGPPAGMIIMGRTIDERMLGDTGGIQRYSISITPISGDVPVARPGIVPEQSTVPGPQGQAVHVTPVNDTLVKGTTALPDIRGNDALLLTVFIPRDIYHQGQSTILTFFLIFANAALIIGIIVIWLIDNLLLSRLGTLIENVEDLGKRRDPAGRLVTNGNDEITFLSAAMNRTLDELENAQTDLQQKERSYRTLIETTPTSIAQTDLSGTIMFVNQQMALSHGYDNTEEIRGRFLFDFIAPEDRDRAMQDLARILHEGRLRNVEYRGVRRDMSRFWMEMSVSVLRDTEGNPESFIVVSRDISRRKNQEANLKEKIRELEEAKHGLQKSEARYRDIATNIPGIVFQFVVHENDLQSVPFISERVFDLFTLGPDEIYSNPNALFNLIHDEDTAHARDSLVHSAQTLEPWNVEFRMKPRNDEIRWFNGRAVPHRLENGDVMWDGVLIDITESRVLQEKIGAALKEKELLLKEIHHRVKNNIQVIASLLSMQARTVDDTAIKEVLREAQNRVKSIALVHEKLYQSKSLDRIEYRDYLQKISRHLYESYGVSPRNVAMNIHADAISLHIDKAVPCSLIINELLSNAFKHAFPDGRKGDIWIDIEKNGTSMIIRYRDNGIGLPENISVEQSETLGMRLLHGLTRQLHGTIEIVPGDGTRITITFPHESPPGEAA